MRNRDVVLSLLLILSLIAFSGACKKKAVDTTPAEPAEDVATPPPPPPPPTREVEEDYPSQQEGFGERDQQPTDIDALNQAGFLQTVYFAFDSFDLTPSTQATLRDNAERMKAHPSYNVLILGHCDERGTIEYNLALGERRANAVRDYLVSLGIERSRIRVISYGEERPAAPGHDEAAWSQNRRAEFLFED
jgi:peptidoglycan-associated lipoprotein